MASIMWGEMLGANLIKGIGKTIYKRIKLPGFKIFFDFF